MRSPQRADLERLLRAAGIDATTMNGDELLVPGVPTRRVGEIAAAAGIVLDELVQQNGSLEDVFLELTSEAPA